MRLTASIAVMAFMTADTGLVGTRGAVLPIQGRVHTF